MANPRLQSIERQALQPAHQLLRAVEITLEFDQVAEQGDELAARAAQHRAARHARPLVELGEDPALLLAHELLDVAPRRAQRRRDLEPVGVHRDAERAPAPTHEAVLHLALAEANQPSALCCSSIHVLAS